MIEKTNQEWKEKTNQLSTFKTPEIPKRLITPETLPIYKLQIKDILWLNEQEWTIMNNK